MTNARVYANARLLRLFVAAFVLLFGALTLACSDGPDTPPGAVHVLTTDGDVNPIMERYIDRGIDAAENEDAAAVVIRLDTHGGLLTSMDDIIQRILDSEVPVIVYVWPAAARRLCGVPHHARSHVAVMAPATTIGSATPISGTGEDLGDDLRNKIIGDSVAKIAASPSCAAATRLGGGCRPPRHLRGQHRGGDENIVDYAAEDLDELLARWTASR
jgi:membrane-bound serine protease (ClpP class)